jgi:HEPN domain-containing protein
MKESYKRWIEMALDDLNAARANFDIGQYYVCAQLSHQAAEKALKALVIKDLRELPHVHDLTFLAKAVKADKSALSKLAMLSAIYIETKYGSREYRPSEKFDEDNTSEFLSAAGEIVEWCQKRI